MSIVSRWQAIIALLLFGTGGAIQAQTGYDDPSGRVGRINHMKGDVSYSPSGEDEWLQAARNRPVISGDRLWTGRGARLELQMGSAAVRLDGQTSFELLDLDDRFAQFQVSQGAVNLTIRRLREQQDFEIATPNLVFTTDVAGRYRIDFEPETQETTVTVWRGRGEVYGDDGNLHIEAGESVRFYGNDLADYDVRNVSHSDSFDRYCLDRDQVLERSVSLRYLDDDVIGYVDLDLHGRWYAERNYGNVWYPNQVANDWAPYRDGHWVWQEPWGWTWVDNAVWGFAPSHYGRWIHLSGRWGWIPGPRNVRPIYAPALVAFVGGRNWSLSVSFGNRSPVGWFPLGPREPYYPSYRASRDYFTRVNVNNTTINTTIINNTYNNYASGQFQTNQVYANRTVQGALTAVPSEVFVNARPVRGAMLALDQRALSTGSLTRMAAIAPSQRSVLGADSAARVRPERQVFDRSVMVRTAPPAEQQSFQDRSQQLQRNPGLVPEPTPRGNTNHSASDENRNVRVLLDSPAMRTDMRESDKPVPERRSLGDPQRPNPQVNPNNPGVDSQRIQAEQQERQRQTDQQEQQRQSEQARQAEQQNRQAEQSRQVEQQNRQAEQARQVEQQNMQAEQARQVEQQNRQAEQQNRQAEQARLIEQQNRDAEQARQAEQQAREAEAQRQSEQRPIKPERDQTPRGKEPRSDRDRAEGEEDEDDDKKDSKGKNPRKDAPRDNASSASPLA
ncbi:MAG: hypothetical protein IPK97_05010 [Ahniella sp.]|nr:hypothetical protein [Ahniella sp.]